MGTVNVTLSKKGTNVTLFEVKIDDAPVRFDDDDFATAALSAGENHRMDWFARGREGSSYSIRITSPIRLRFQHGDKLDSGGEDSGSHTFEP